MGNVKWIRLDLGMFDNKKIRHIRRLPDGNDIVLIWVMLLTMAGNCNAGGWIFLTEKIPYTITMLSDELGFKESTVELALKALESLEMIHFDGDMFCITNWEEHQNMEGLDKLKQQRKEINARYYEKKKLEKKEENKTENKTEIKTSYKTSENVLSDTLEEEGEEEKEKEGEREINKEISTSLTVTIDYLNHKAGTSFNFRTLPQKTVWSMMQRLEEGFTPEDFKKVIDKKVEEWKGTKMQSQLNPSTLFGDKFSIYLNQLSDKPKKKGKSKCQERDNNYDALSVALIRDSMEG